MKALIQKMNIMLDSVGKNVLSKNNSKEYEKVVNQQEILEFCEIISDSFQMKIHNELLAKDLDARRKIITKFLNVLKESHEKDLWKSFESDDKKSISEFFDVFKMEEFYIESISVNYPQKVGNKFKLLFDYDNLEKIEDIMIIDRYFYGLMQY